MNNQYAALVRNDEVRVVSFEMQLESDNQQRSRMKHIGTALPLYNVPISCVISTQIRWGSIVKE